MRGVLADRGVHGCGAGAVPPILPTLLQLLAGCYGIYTLYLGLPVLMHSPKERAVGYTATVVVCTFLMGIVFTVASMALGLGGHAAGLLGGNQQISQQQRTGRRRCDRQCAGH